MCVWEGNSHCNGTHECNSSRVRCELWMLLQIGILSSVSCSFASIYLVFVGIWVQFGVSLGSKYELI